MILQKEEKKMPAVSFYLKKDLLDAVRAKAKARNVPASRIIQEAVEQYLSLSEKRRAKERVLGFLVREKPLGGMEGWEKLHRERDHADADRR
mgnify:CR=1 FL=1